MDVEKIKDSVFTFVRFLPETLKRTSIWMIISYLIPVINIAIIWGIRGQFDWNINTLSILLVTNACFITSLLFLIDRKREFTNVINTISLVVTVVLFAFSIAQIEKEMTIFPLLIYKSGAFLTLIASLLVGLISKYDEVEARSLQRAESGRAKKETTIGNKTIKL